MTKWEYATQPMQSTDHAKMGDEGWELVAVADGMLFFKRAVPEPEPEKPAKK